MIEIAARIDKGAARFRHLLAINRDKAVHANLGGGAEFGTAQHGGPKQRMEVNYIFADKMVELSSAISLPVVIEIHAFAIAEIFKAGHIADWRIQPDIKVLARRIGNLKAKVGSIATDIPLLQAAVEPLAEFVGHFFLHRATARPVLQKLSKLRQLKEIVG